MQTWDKVRIRHILAYFSNDPRPFDTKSEGKLALVEEVHARTELGVDEIDTRKFVLYKHLIRPDGWQSKPLDAKVCRVARLIHANGFVGRNRCIGRGPAEVIF